MSQVLIILAAFLSLGSSLFAVEFDDNELRKIIESVGEEIRGTNGLGDSYAKALEGSWHTAVSIIRLKKDGFIAQENEFAAQLIFKQIFRREYLEENHIIKFVTWPERNQMGEIVDWWDSLPENEKGHFPTTAPMGFTLVPK